MWSQDPDSVQGCTLLANAHMTVIV